MPSGVFVKNIALCFDHARDQSRPPETTNASTLCALMISDDDQLVWSRAVTRRAGRYHFAAPRRRSSARDIARASVTEAEFRIGKDPSPGDPRIHGTLTSSMRALTICAERQAPRRVVNGLELLAVLPPGAAPGAPRRWSAPSWSS